ncbi:MAG: hypothetical protein ACRD1H_09630, partial [Vicinamibacterales bacterium]
MRAINRRDLVLPGLVGTIAEAIEVPRNLETAVEVALGGHLQDIIVVSWGDARTAIEYLKRSQSGRATFQPLETVRSGRRPELTDGMPGLLGVAADLVSCDERIRPVIEQLLGRTLIATDLETSRCMVSAETRWTTVTLAGEITRPSGSVTGGGRVAEAGLLGRERERRALPERISKHAAEVRSLQEQHDRANEMLANLERERHARQSYAETTRRQLAGARMELDRLLRAVGDSELSVNQVVEHIDGLAGREQGISASSAAIAARRDTLLAEQASVGAERGRAEQAVGDINDDGGEALAGFRADLAASTERQRTAENAAQRAVQRAINAARSAENRRAEGDQLRRSAKESDIDRTAIDAEVAELRQFVASTRAALPPVQRQRDDLSAALADGERNLNRAAERLRDAERERDRTTLTLARGQDEQVFLGERIRGDLELDDPATLDSVNLGGDGVPSEQEVTRLRDRLRRMSNVGDDVLEQFETESARLAYLSTQLADLDEAADGLRSVLAELHTKMTTRFEG